MINTLDRQLLLTICYSAQFGYPLTVGELVLRCFSVRRPQAATLDSAKNIDSDKILKSVKKLISAGILNFIGGYLFLSGREGTVATRSRHKKSSTQKFTELEPLIKFLRKLPGIAGVAVTGSAAVFNADIDDDVDLLIITENHRLWLLRPLVVLFAFLHGKRRTWSKEEKNSWCFNLWLERRSLAQSVETRSLYIAYEVCQAKWLLDVKDCKQSFLRQNSWVSRYLPTYYSWCKNQGVVYEVAKGTTALSYWPGISELASVGNYMLYFLQRLYMSSHMTRERVSSSFAFFHPRDTGSIIARNYRDIVYELVEKSR